MVVCLCRNIDSADFKSESDLKDRIMQNDWKCGMCQLYYEINSDLKQ